MPDLNPSALPVFVYGSLLFETVQQGVLQRAPLFRSAILRDYARYALEQAAYPAIVPVAGEQVEGGLLAVTAAELARLDHYEGDEYQRLEVVVATGSGLESAWVYVLAPDYLHRLSDRGWSPLDFSQHSLSSFLRQLKL